MTDHVTPGDRPPAREQADQAIARVLQQEMMSRRFITNAPHCPRLQSGVLLVCIGVLMLLVMQQVISTDPAMQIAHQQRGAPSATGAIAKPVPLVPERNDP